MDTIIEEDQQQYFQKNMWQSSIEIHFNFYSVPQRIGLVKDKFIDQLSFNKDNILVNDDDFEDLIRVCNLFNLFNLTKQEIYSTLSRDFYTNHQHFLSLFQKFENKQITRSIPRFFKDNYAKNDYRIYMFDDVQRKVIYGMLRRSYALMAEVVL